MFQEKAKTSGDPWQRKSWSGIISGVARFPKLNEPDRFDPSRPRWTVGLMFEADGDYAGKLQSEFDAMLDWAMEQLPPAKRKRTEKVLPIKADYRKVNANTPQEDYEETGYVFVEAKTNYLGPQGDVRPLPIFDAKAQRVTDIPTIGGGSKLRAAVSIVPYWMDGKLGLTLYLNGVQIIELSEGYSNEPVFSEEDGWSASTESGGAVFDGDTPF